MPSGFRFARLGVWIFQPALWGFLHRLEEPANVICAELAGDRRHNTKTLATGMKANTSKVNI